MDQASRADRCGLELIWKELLRITASNVGNQAQELWKIVAARAEQLDALGDLAERVVELTDLIDECDNLKDVVASEPLAKAVFGRLETDMLMLQVAASCGDALAAGHPTLEAQAFVERAYALAHPRLRMTHERVCHAIRGAGASSEFVTELDQRWHAGRSARASAQREVNDDEYKLPDWVDP
jgi:hypothetical protein